LIVGVALIVWIFPGAGLIPLIGARGLYGFLAAALLEVALLLECVFGENSLVGGFEMLAFMLVRFVAAAGAEGSLLEAGNVVAVGDCATVDVTALGIRGSAVMASAGGTSVIIDDFTALVWTTEGRLGISYLIESAWFLGSRHIYLCGIRKGEGRGTVSLL